MTPLELLKQQNELFEKNMLKVINEFNKSLVAMVSKLDSVNGKLLITDNVKNAVLIKKQIGEALKDAGYFDLIKNTVEANEKILDLQMIDIGKRIGSKFGSIDQTTIRALFKMDFTGMQNLADTAMPAISNAIMQSVMVGAPVKKMMEAVEGQLGKFEGYAKTYLKTAKSQFIQNTEDIIANDIGFGEDKDDIWEYFGAPLQDNSHEECIWALERKPHTPYFTDTERQEFEAGGGYSHSEPRWNCQHNFLMTNLTFKEYKGE